VEKIVGGIIADVRENGDAAILKYCRKFDVRS
jgi:histidinol dehydrogenase